MRGTFLYTYRLVILTCVSLPIEVASLILARFSASLKKRYVDDMKSVMYDVPMTEEDYGDSVFSLGYLRQWYRSRYLDLSKNARLGYKAPNPTVQSIGRTGVFHKLLDFQKASRPLIINFGSCT